MPLASHFLHPHFLLSFFFTDPSTPEIYTLSLHDALPISAPARPDPRTPGPPGADGHRHRHELQGAHPVLHPRLGHRALEDRKSTRLNSSHQIISYAVFCLKKKKTKTTKSTAMNEQSDN